MVHAYAEVMKLKHLPPRTRSYYSQFARENFVTCAASGVSKSVASPASPVASNLGSPFLPARRGSPLPSLSSLVVVAAAAVVVASPVASIVHSTLAYTIVPAVQKFAHQNSLGHESLQCWAIL